MYNSEKVSVRGHQDPERLGFAFSDFGRQESKDEEGGWTSGAHLKVSLQFMRVFDLVHLRVHSRSIHLLEHLLDSNNKHTREVFVQEHDVSLKLVCESVVQLLGYSVDVISGQSVVPVRSNGLDLFHNLFSKGREQELSGPELVTVFLRTEHLIVGQEVLFSWTDLSAVSARDLGCLQGRYLLLLCLHILSPRNPTLEQEI